MRNRYKSRMLQLTFIIMLGFVIVSTGSADEKKSLTATNDIQFKRGYSTSEDNITPPVVFSTVEEVEPNNGVDNAQEVFGPSPASVEGNAEVSDQGDIGFTFNNGFFDDFEDLFIVTITSSSLLITLTDGESDLDLWLFDDELRIHDSSTNIGIVDEEIDNDTLAVGTYFIGVSIYDEDPVGPNTSPYTLTIEGDLTEPTSVELRTDGIPTGYLLSDNYPNPFNPTTKINYDIPQTGHVDLKVYNMLGQEIATLVSQNQAAGSYVVDWDGRNGAGVQVPSGIYFYQMKVGNFTQIKRMLLAK